MTIDNIMLSLAVIYFALALTCTTVSVWRGNWAEASFWVQFTALLILAHLHATLT